MTKARVVAQLLSAVAVALSLAFVGLEVRQNTVAQRAQTRQGLADASRDFILSRATDPDLSRIWHSTWTGSRRYVTGTLEPLTTVDSLRGVDLMYANLRNLENVYLQSLEGVIDQSVMDGYGFSMALYQTPEFRSFWQYVRAGTIYDPRFLDAFGAANGLD